MRIGGRTWKRAPIEDTSKGVACPLRIYAIDFLPPSTAKAVGDCGVSLSSRNGGRTWAIKGIGNLNLPALERLAMQREHTTRHGIERRDRSIRMSNDTWQDGEKVDAVGSNRELYYSSDGGETWKMFASGNYVGIIGRLDPSDGQMFTPEDVWWLLGTKGGPLDFMGADPAGRYPPLEIDVSAEVGVGTVLPDGWAWVVDTKAIVYWTKVNEKSPRWTARPISPLKRGERVDSVVFHGNGFGFAVGTEGSNLVTTNHGSTWSATTRSAIRRPFWTDGVVVIGVKADGTVLRSPNRGRTWSPVVFD